MYVSVVTFAKRDKNDQKATKFCFAFLLTIVRSTGVISVQNYAPMNL